MKSWNVPLIISLLIVMFIIGSMFGYFISPTYQQTMYQPEVMGLGTADRFLDLRYANQMATHHQGAILLADQALGKSQRSEIRTLAQEIQANEPKLIDELYGWKRDWYKDNRPAPQPQVPQLGTSDETFDLRFLNALIAHHQEGINMTQEVKIKSSRSEVLNNANEVEQFLTSSMQTLKEWRKAWYGI